MLFVVIFLSAFCILISLDIFSQHVLILIKDCTPLVCRFHSVGTELDYQSGAHSSSPLTPSNQNVTPSSGTPTTSPDTPTGRGKTKKYAGRHFTQPITEREKGVADEVVSPAVRMGSSITNR